MYNDYLVTSDMTHVTSRYEKKCKKTHTIQHEPHCMAFHHRGVHSMSCTV